MSRKWESLCGIYACTKATSQSSPNDKSVRMDLKLFVVMRPTDHRDIFVRLHPFFYPKKNRFTPLYILYIYIYQVLMTSLKNTLNQSQRLWSAHTNPLTLFGGVVLTTPPIFELTNHSAPFSHVTFSLDQSERSILPLTNQKPDPNECPKGAHTTTLF